MRHIHVSDLFVSIVDLKRKEDLFAYDLQHNLEVAYFYSPEVLESDYSKDVEAFSDFIRLKKIESCVHGPMVDMNYQSRDPKIRDVVALRYGQLFDIAQKLGAGYMVIHSTYNPLSAQHNYEEKWIKNVLERLPVFVRRAEELGITLLMENIFDPSPSAISKLVKAVNSPRLKACIDIGHWHLFSKVPIREWVDTYGQDLSYFHLHDNGGIFDDHGPLGSGKVPITEVFQALESSPAQPKYCIEVNQLASVEPSLNYLRRLGVLVDE